MEIEEPEFDEHVNYKLRVELLNGKVLLYRIDTQNKQYWIEKLRANSEGDEDAKTLRFLWFETASNHSVIINTDSFARVTFCFDPINPEQKDNTYYDNFDLVQKDTEIEEQETKEGEKQLHVTEGIYLPQAIIYHKRKAPDDFYDNNPLTYAELDEGCLTGLNLELEGHFPLRQFIGLIDNDGEEGFIPTNQIIVMEFDNNLVFLKEDEEMEGEAETE